MQADPDAAEGLCDVAVSVYAATPRSGRRTGGGFRSRTGGPATGWSLGAEWERWTGRPDGEPYGVRAT